MVMALRSAGGFRELGRLRRRACFSFSAAFRVRGSVDGALGAGTVCSGVDGSAAADGLATFCGDAGADTAAGLLDGLVLVTMGSATAGGVSAGGSGSAPAAHIGSAGATAAASSWTGAAGGCSTGTLLSAGALTASDTSAELGSGVSGGAETVGIETAGTARLSPAPCVAAGTGAGFRGPGVAAPSLLRPKLGLIWMRDRLVDIAEASSCGSLVP